MLKLGIKQHEGHVAFHDVITALVKHSYATSSYVDQVSRSPTTCVCMYADVCVCVCMCVCVCVD